MTAAVVLAGATAACTAQPSRAPLPGVTASPAGPDRPADAAVRTVCDRSIAAARDVLGDDAHVGTPYAMHQPSPAVQGIPRLDCESNLMLCRPIPARPVTRLQELDVTVLDPSRESATPLPAGVATNQIDGVPVYVHGLSTAPSDNGGPWFWLVVHNQRVEVEIRLYNTVAASTDRPPNPQTLDACNAAWGGTWPKMAQAIITALR